MGGAKKTYKEFSVEVGSEHICPFEGQGFILPVSQLPHGVTQATPVQIKFTESGQHIHGQYLGGTLNKSRNEKMKDFYFHEVKLPSGSIVGFCGSTQLDTVLGKVIPLQFDVHIMYAGEKKLDGNQKLKIFHIFTRIHIVKNPVEPALKYDKHGEIIEDEEF